MSPQLDSQVAVVTGATRGIGRATALCLAEAGARVAVLARTEADVRAVAREIQLLPGFAMACAADVTDGDQVDRAFERVLEEYGRLDILVNNAGTGIRKPFSDMTSADWDLMIDLNLKGLLNCTRAALSCMLARGQGSIIHIASRAGRHPEQNLAVYSATKAAVIAFSQALAREVDPDGIRVAAICPGPVDTERLRQTARHADRTGWLKPEDVARAILSAVSPLSQAENGAVLDLF